MIRAPEQAQQEPGPTQETEDDAQAETPVSTPVSTHYVRKEDFYTILVSGVATATVCALMNMECVVYMGKTDVERQRINVEKMKMLDHAEVGEGAIVAAGSVVTGKTKIGPNELWAGAPAKFIKMVDPAQAKEINIKIAKNYLMYSKWYTEEE